MRILVVAAHPDDEVLGCGATVARLAGDGHETHIAIMGEGLRPGTRNRNKLRRNSDIVYTSRLGPRHAS